MLPARKIIFLCGELRGWGKIPRWDELVHVRSIAAAEAKCIKTREVNLQGLDYYPSTQCIITETGFFEVWATFHSGTGQRLYFRSDTAEKVSHDLKETVTLVGVELKASSAPHQCHSLVFFSFSHSALTPWIATNWRQPLNNIFLVNLLRVFDVEIGTMSPV